MKEDENERGLVCLSVAYMPVPHTPSEKDKCGKCGTPVWRALSSPRELPVICNACFREIEARKKVAIMPPTLEQYEDLRRYSN